MLVKAQGAFSSGATYLGKPLWPGLQFTLQNKKE